MRNASGPCLGSGHPPIARARGPRYIDPGDARGYPQRLSAGEGVTVDSLKGRVGVVTGGASGIGRAMVEAFAREGARVVVADLDERSEEHTSELQSPCNLVCRLLLEKKKTT